MQFKLLAVGVAVAACFTSVATPAYSAESGKYLYGAGTSLVVDSQDKNQERVLGGSTTSTDYKTGSVTVNAGNWDMVVGGSYLTDPPQTEFKIGFDSTEVTINSSKDNEVQVQHVVGGTSSSNAHSVVSDADTKRTAKLTINGGTYGRVYDWEAKDVNNVLKSLIVGGDHFKNNPGENPKDPNRDNTTDVYLDSAETKISDATVNALVIGGSLANQYYAQVDSGVYTVNV